jgi:hypothetical protein
MKWKRGTSYPDVAVYDNVEMMLMGSATSHILMVSRSERWNGGGGCRDYVDGAAKCT